MTRYLFLLTALPVMGWAQTIPDLQAKVNALESATRAAQSAGDNVWMLVSSALVLSRGKNVLGTMMQSFTMMAVVTMLWAVVGYGLVFDAGLGGLRYALLNGVGSSLGYDDSTDAFGVHHPGQIWNQLLCCAIGWALAILDIGMHGEEGYYLEA